MELDLGDTIEIMNEAKKQGLLRNQLSYVLATAYWETNHTVKPVVEAYWLSESWRKRNLRYYPWHGRGYVQLTWEANYVKAGKKLGLDLTTDPNVVLKPDVACKILVLGLIDGWLTGQKLSTFTPLSKSDFQEARRIIHGPDKAAELVATSL